MKLILSHSGKQHSYQVAKAMKQLGVLEKFYTSTYIRQFWLQKFLKEKGDNYWTRRFELGVSGKDVDANWRFEIKELVYRKFHGNSQRTINAVYARDEAFDQYVSKKIEQSSANVFWGFQGSCLESIKAAKNSGKLAVCEQAAVHLITFKKILEEEKALHPVWASSIDSLNMPKRYENRLIDEVNLADRVVVASEFSKQSVIHAGIDKSKIIKLPLGFDSSTISVKSNFSCKKNTPLKCLFVGRMTQGKGIYYLLEAFKRLNPENYELTMIGSMQGDIGCFEPYKNICEYLPPMSMLDLHKIYRNYDILVHPSLTEGFGLVILEAMAAGLPVITTFNTFGPEIISHGINGHLIPIRDINAIEESLIYFQKQKAEGLLEKMSVDARKAAEKFTWKSYSYALNEVLNTNLTLKIN